MRDWGNYFVVLVTSPCLLSHFYLKTSLIIPTIYCPQFWGSSGPPKLLLLNCVHHIIKMCTYDYLLTSHSKMCKYCTICDTRPVLVKPWDCLDLLSLHIQLSKNATINIEKFEFSDFKKNITCNTFVSGNTLTEKFDISSQCYQI